MGKTTKNVPASSTALSIPAEATPVDVSRLPSGKARAAEMLDIALDNSDLDFSVIYIAGSK